MINNEILCSRFAIASRFTWTNGSSLPRVRANSILVQLAACVNLKEHFSSSTDARSKWHSKTSLSHQAKCHMTLMLRRVTVKTREHWRSASKNGTFPHKLADPPNFRLMFKQLNNGKFYFAVIWCKAQNTKSKSRIEKIYPLACISSQARIRSEQASIICSAPILQQHNEGSI